MTFEPFYVNLAHAHKAVGRSYINVYISVADVRQGGLAPARPIKGEELRVYGPEDVVIN